MLSLCANRIVCVIPGFLNVEELCRLIMFVIGDVVYRFNDSCIACWS
jgi:hypothetical protein